MKRNFNLNHPEAFRNNRNDELDLVIQILQVYNPRIREILSLPKSQIFPGKYAYLCGSKGSADIIIRDREILHSLESLSLERTDKIFVYTSYHNVYQYIKNFMPEVVDAVRYKKHRHVTHAFRYINAKVPATQKTIKAVLHHNSERSNHYYTS